MAISLPSDIVLDVARAAAPDSIETAHAALARRATAVADAAGAFALENTAATRAASRAKAVEPFRKFEAMVLQSFVENMLPKDGADVYGKGMAGDMWKSMMAEKIAAVMSERGGIGIADHILGDHYMKGEKAVPVGAISGGPEQLEADQQAMLSTALVQQMQMRLTRALSGDDTSTNDPSAGS